MSSIRSKNTKLEDTITKELWRRGFRFRKNVKDLLGKPDIAIKNKKVVIFIDSCFWHGCETHGREPETNTEYWSKKLTRNKNRDNEVARYYNQIGWNILRVWEHEVKADFNGVIEKIANFIDKSTK